MTQLNLPPLHPEIPSDSSEEENYVELILERVEELLEKDPGLLFSHMYRLDIEEKVINTILKISPPDQISRLLAQEIWRRQKVRMIHKKNTSVKPIQDKGWEY